ncbi:MAG: DUF2441 domain-containing protein [Bacilli bacterium]|nr:DUF2441 domain-containing protein [Bacilli bacterium]
MKIVNKKFFHFHRADIHPELWKSGKVIKVDNSFQSRIGQALDSYSGIVDLYLKYLENPSENEHLLVEFNRMIESGMFIFTAAFQREVFMEIARRLVDPSLPSRKNSIWLCDANGLRHWCNVLDEKTDRYIVSATGEVFKSSDAFIPDSFLNGHDMIEKSKKYWDPVFTEPYHENQAEYLFQGEIKILKKIN